MNRQQRARGWKWVSIRKRISLTLNESAKKERPPNSVVISHCKTRIVSFSQSLCEIILQLCAFNCFRVFCVHCAIVEFQPIMLLSFAVSLRLFHLIHWLGSSCVSVKDFQLLNCICKFWTIRITYLSISFRSFAVSFALVFVRAATVTVTIAIVLMLLCHCQC